MRQIKLPIVGLCATLMILLTNNCFATPVTWYLGGLLNPNSTMISHLAAFSSGDSFLIELNFDDTDLNSVNPNYGEFAVSSFTITLGAHSITPNLSSGNGNLIAVNDSGGTDYFQYNPNWTGQNWAPVSPYQLSDFSFQMSDYDGTLLTNGQIPSLLPTLSVFESAYAGFGFAQPGSQFGIGGGGPITYFSTTAPGGSPVPEPTTMLLFGTGLIGLVGVARRKRK